MNLRKLLSIRSCHERLHSDYRRLAESVRAGNAEVARLLSEAGPDLPEGWQTMPHDDLLARGLDPSRLARAQIVAEQTGALRLETQLLATRLADSRALVERLNAYAQD